MLDGVLFLFLGINILVVNCYKKAGSVCAG